MRAFPDLKYYDHMRFFFQQLKHGRQDVYYLPLVQRSRNGGFSDKTEAKNAMNYIVMNRWCLFSWRL